MFNWICEHCRRPIDDLEGVVRLDDEIVARHRGRNAAWEAEVIANSEDPNKPQYTIEAFRNYPEQPHWEVTHIGCDPHVHGRTHDLGVEELRSAGQLLSWVAGLLSYPWIMETDLQQLLDNLANGKQNLRIPRHRPRND